MRGGRPSRARLYTRAPIRVRSSSSCTAGLDVSGHRQNERPPSPPPSPSTRRRFASPGARLPVVARARAAPPISMVSGQACSRRRGLSPPLQKTLEAWRRRWRRARWAPSSARRRPSATSSPRRSAASRSPNTGGRRPPRARPASSGWASGWRRSAGRRRLAAAPAARAAVPVADVEHVREARGLADDYGVPRDEFAKQLGSLYQIFLTWRASRRRQAGRPPDGLGAAQLAPSR